MKVLIKNSNVVFDDCVKKKDILIENKKISKIGESLNEKDSVLVNGDGFFCMPGFFDVHVHLRDPGFLEKETVETGAKAAAKGGVTSLCCMANTKPVIDSLEHFKLLEEKIKKEKINIFPIAAITKNLEGKELVNFKELSSKVFGFSDDGFFVENSKLFKKAMEEAKKLNIPILSHCEDTFLLDDEASESVAIAKTIALCLLTNCPVHICHVSTKDSIMLIKAAKEMGVKITAETAPHYFMLTEEDAKGKDPNFKMNPPLRKKEDRAAVENAILDGTLDCIATDHAPHEKENKKDFKTALNGVIGLETLFSSTLTNFYHNKKTSLSFVSRILSKNPAKILNIKNKGEIEIGYDADLVLVDINKSFEVKESDFVSKSKNSPFIGKVLKGKVLKTFCGGELIYK